MKNSVDINKVSHFLFDYDGLLVDSEKLYFETWCLVLTDEGKEVCHQFHEGKHESEVYEKVKKHLKKPILLEEVSQYRKKMFDQLIAEGRLELIEGMKSLLDRLSEIAPMSIVSNSTVDVVEDGIRAAGIESYFGNLYCYSDEVNRKPAPDLYNWAIEALNLEKSTTLALEDSKTGVVSAQEAGLPVICLNSNSLMKDFCEEYGVEHFESVAELTSKI